MILAMVSSAYRVARSRNCLSRLKQRSKALRERKIRFVSQERDDQIARRAARGSRDGRPPAFDAELYKQRTPAWLTDRSPPRRRCYQKVLVDGRRFRCSICRSSNFVSRSRRATISQELR
jgi:hypothetical protein